MSRTKVTIEGYKNYCQKNAVWQKIAKRLARATRNSPPEKTSIVVNVLKRLGLCDPAGVN